MSEIAGLSSVTASAFFPAIWGTVYMAALIWAAWRNGYRSR